VLTFAVPWDAVLSPVSPLFCEFCCTLGPAPAYFTMPDPYGLVLLMRDEVRCTARQQLQLLGILQLMQYNVPQAVRCTCTVAAVSTFAKAGLLNAAIVFTCTADAVPLACCCLTHTLYVSFAMLPTYERLKQYHCTCAAVVFTCTSTHSADMYRIFRTHWYLLTLFSTTS
jgi:hypothetical protein